MLRWPDSCPAFPTLTLSGGHLRFALGQALLTPARPPHTGEGLNDSAAVVLSAGTVAATS